MSRRRRGRPDDGVIAGDDAVVFLRRLLAAKGPAHRVLINSEASLRTLIGMMQSMLDITDADRTRLNLAYDQMYGALNAAGVKKLGEAIIVCASLSLGLVATLEEDVAKGAVAVDNAAGDATVASTLPPSTSSMRGQGKDQ